MSKVHLDQLSKLISYWEEKLTSSSFLLEPSARLLIELTIKSLRELRQYKEENVKPDRP